MDNNISQSELHEKTILVENIIDSISSALFLIDQNRDVLKYNKAFIEMFDVNFKLNHLKCFQAINIASKKSGVEYFKLRFNEKDETEESRRCVLNMAVNKAINANIATENQIVGDEYYVDGELRYLYLKFSVKPLNINNKKYILVVVDDISEFETTKFNLLKNNIKIKRYNNMYKNELVMARRVQSAILPKQMFLSDGFKIDFRYFPLGEIGGDVFDFFKIDDNHIGILVCDVVGHGVHSALITTMIKAMIETARDLQLFPKKLTGYINEKFIKILGDSFLTMIYGVIDVRTGIFDFVRAGHPKPWLLNKNAVSTMGIKNNMMIGVDPDIKFKEERIMIEKGSKLIMFTDGLVDIGRKNSGYEQEIMNLIKHESEKENANILNKIEQNIKTRLSDEKHQDDICVIMVERLND